MAKRSYTDAYETTLITNNNTKKRVVAAIIQALTSTLIPIFTAVYFEEIMFLWLMLPLFILGFYIADKFTLTKTFISLDQSENLIIDNNQFTYIDIVGYYTHDDIYNSIYIRLKNDQIIKITSLSFGKRGKQYDRFRKLFLKNLKRKNKHHLILLYQDIFQKQGKALRYVLYFIIGILIIFDILVIILISNGNDELPLMVFMVNLSIFGVIPFLQKGKLEK